MCTQPSNHRGCGQKFKSILESIQCPDELISTHAVCYFCLDIYQRAKNHNKFCIFAKRGLKLSSAGWATPASSKVLRSIRQNSFRYRNPLINLLHDLFIELNVERAILIPIPMSCAGRGDRWLELICDASKGLDQVDVKSFFKREKQQSTRKSVAQTRIQIVEQEYMIDEDAARQLHGKRVILVDDNVTTGNTLTHCARIIQPFSPVCIQLISIDRTISTRIIQRCPTVSNLICSFINQEKNKT
jgi:predicted amidophosphoribosyltransferase